MEGKEVVNELVRIYHEHKLAHAYLLETNDVEKCYLDIITIVKNMFCPTKKYISSCEEIDKCNICYLIDTNNLPSLITIEPDGKNIKKEAVDKLKAAFSMMPIYTDSNVYIMKYPEKMNNTAYNKMLKFLEEPEDNLYGFFICESKENVASTIVSRCEIIKCLYYDGSENAKLGISKEDYDALLPISDKYYHSIYDGNNIWANYRELTNNLSTREECIVFLKILNDMFINDYKNSSNKTVKLLKYVQIVQKYLEELNYNVNINLLIQSFCIEMGDNYGK